MDEPRDEQARDERVRLRMLLNSAEWEEIVKPALAARLRFIEGYVLSNDDLGIEALRRWQGEHGVLAELLTEPLRLADWLRVERERR